MNFVDALFVVGDALFVVGIVSTVILTFYFVSISDGSQAMRLCEDQHRYMRTYIVGLMGFYMFLVVEPFPLLILTALLKKSVR